MVGSRIDVRVGWSYLPWSKIAFAGVCMRRSGVVGGTQKSKIGGDALGSSTFRGWGWDDWDFNARNPCWQCGASNEGAEEEREQEE